MKKLKYIIVLSLVFLLSAQYSTVAFAQDNIKDEEIVEEVIVEEETNEETVTDEEVEEEIDEVEEQEDSTEDVEQPEMIAEEENTGLSLEETEALRAQQELDGLGPKAESMDAPQTRAAPYWTGSKGNRYFYNGYGELYGGGPSIKVIDVSEHQGRIDWNTVASSGEVDAVILRLGWGWDTLDKQFNYNISELNRLGIPYGLYLYSYADTIATANAEANFVKSVLARSDVRPSLPMYYDIENWPNGGYMENGVWHGTPNTTSQYVSIITTFINSLRAAGYSDTYVYSYRSYVQGILNDSRILKDVAWIAEYGSKLNYNNTQYSGFTGWQYTSKGSVPGIAGNVDISAFYGSKTPQGAGVRYKAHNQNVGWGTEKLNGDTAGAFGANRRLEALQVSLYGVSNYTISARVHVANEGWKTYNNTTGVTLGTTGKTRAIESISLSLNNVPDYKLQYRVHVKDLGWLDWTDDGAVAGTTGSSTAIEAIQIKLVPKNTPTPKPTLITRGHVSNRGWMTAMGETGIIGTTGQSRGLEAFKIALANAPADAKITGSVHIKNRGWRSYNDASNAIVLGTTGQSLTLEAINLRLVGIPGYKLQYRVHLQNRGWMPWQDEGTEAGTTGRSIPIEAIEIRIVKK